MFSRSENHVGDFPQESAVVIDAATIEQLIAGASEFIPAPANLQPENELNVTPQAFDLLRQSVRALEYRVSALEAIARCEPEGAPL